MKKILFLVWAFLCLAEVQSQDLKAVMILGTFNECGEVIDLDYDYIKIYEDKVDYDSWYVHELSKNLSLPDSLRLDESEIQEMSLGEILERKLQNAPPVLLEGRKILRVISLEKKYLGIYVYNKGKYMCKPHLLILQDDKRFELNKDLEYHRKTLGLNKPNEKVIVNIPRKFREE